MRHGEAPSSAPRGWLVVALVTLTAALPAAGEQQTCRLTVSGAPDADVVPVLLRSYCRDAPGSRWRSCADRETIELSRGEELSVPCASVSGERRALYLAVEGRVPTWVVRDPPGGDRPIDVVLEAGAEFTACLVGPPSAATDAIGKLVFDPVDELPITLGSWARFRHDGKRYCATWSGLPHRAARLVTHRLGGVPAIGVLEPSPSGAVAPTPQPAEPWTPRIVDDDGTPVHSGDLELTWHTPAGTFQSIQDIGDGSVDLPSFSVGRVDLAVRATGRVPWRRARLDRDDLERLREIVLERTGAIEGRCVGHDDDDTGLSDVRVCARTSSGRSAGEEQCVASAQDGTFVLEGLAPDGYDVAFSHADHVDSVIQAIDVIAGDTSDLSTIELPEAIDVTLRIVAADTGDTIAGARVVPSSEASSRSAEATASRSGDDGIVRLRALHPTERSVDVAADGFAPRRVSLIEIDDDVIDVEMDRGVTMRGRVTRDGLPAAGDRVVVRLTSGEIRAIVDRHGDYAMSGLPAGIVTAEHRARSGGVAIRRVELPTAGEVVVDFGAGLRLEGRVTRAGAGVPGATVTLVVPGPSAAGRASPFDDSALRRIPTDVDVRTAVTDAFGEVAFDGLAPAGSEAFLTVSDPRGTQTRRLLLAAEGPMAIELPLDTAVVRGRVVSRRDGTPVRAASVGATRPGSLRGAFTIRGTVAGVRSDIMTRSGASTLADTEGRFELELPAGGTWRVGSTAAGYVSEVAEVDPAVSPPIELALAPKSRRAFRVADPRGFAVPGARVSETTPIDGAGGGGGGRHVPALPSGLVELEGPAGAERFTIASHPLFAPSCAAAFRYPEPDVRADGDVATELRLTDGVSVEVELADDVVLDGSWRLWDASQRAVYPVAAPRLVERSGASWLIFERLPACRVVLEVAGVRRALELVPGEPVVLDRTSFAAGRSE